MIARGMSSRGKQLAVLFAVAIVFFLPKRVECGFPGGKCPREGPFRMICRDYEVEPLGLYLVEWLVKGDVGFAYTTGETCK